MEGLSIVGVSRHPLASSAVTVAVPSTTNSARQRSASSANRNGHACRSASSSLNGTHQKGSAVSSPSSRDLGGLVTSRQLLRTNTSATPASPTGVAVRPMVPSTSRPPLKDVTRKATTAINSANTVAGSKKGASPTGTASGSRRTGTGTFGRSCAPTQATNDVDFGVENLQQLTHGTYGTTVNAHYHRRPTCHHHVDHYYCYSPTTTATAALNDPLFTPATAAQMTFITAEMIASMERLNVAQREASNRDALVEERARAARAQRMADEEAKLSRSKRQAERRMRATLRQL